MYNIENEVNERINNYLIDENIKVANAMKYHSEQLIVWSDYQDQFNATIRELRNAKKTALNVNSERYTRIVAMIKDVFDVTDDEDIFLYMRALGYNTIYNPKDGSVKYLKKLS